MRGGRVLHRRGVHPVLHRLPVRVLPVLGVRVGCVLPESLYRADHLRGRFRLSVVVVASRPEKQARGPDGRCFYQGSRSWSITTAAPPKARHAAAIRRPDMGSLRKIQARNSVKMVEVWFSTAAMLTSV